MPTDSTVATRKRGNPLFPLLARVYSFWTDRFRHDPKVMTPAARKRNVAAFTQAIKAQVLEANPNGVAARDFNQAVEHLKARLDPNAWQTELDKAAGRIEAAILAYADSGYHRKQADRQAASPRRHFDNWLHVVLSTWIDAARNKGLIDRNGVAKHVQKRQAVETPPPLDLDTLRTSVRDRLHADNNRTLQSFRKHCEPAGTKRAADHRRAQAACIAAGLIETWPPDLVDLVNRETSRRTTLAWRDQWQKGDLRWKHQLALLLNECLAFKGDTDA